MNREHQIQDANLMIDLAKSTSKEIMEKLQIRAELFKGVPSILFPFIVLQISTQCNNFILKHLAETFPEEKKNEFIKLQNTIVEELKALDDVEVDPETQKIMDDLKQQMEQAHA